MKCSDFLDLRVSDSELSALINILGLLPFLYEDQNQFIKIHILDGQDFDWSNTKCLYQVEKVVQLNGIECSISRGYLFIYFRFFLICFISFVIFCMWNLSIFCLSYTKIFNFGAIIVGTIFKNFNYSCLLLAYWKIIEFCTPTLYLSAPL